MYDIQDIGGHMKLATKVNRACKKLKMIEDELKQLQEECEHPNATYKYRADTGNWSRVDDTYWIEWRCPDCKKRWTTDQSHEWTKFTEGKARHK